MTEMTEFVERAAAAFAETEKTVQDAYRAVQALAPFMKEGRDLGLAGFLQSSRMKADLHSAAGDIATGLAKVFAVHKEGTDLAIGLGVDLPSVEGGGDR